MASMARKMRPDKIKKTTGTMTEEMRDQEDDLRTAQVQEQEEDWHTEQTVEQTETIEVYELVSTVVTTDDDMRRMADLNDEFTHTMDPILRMYNAAMHVTETRMNIIKDEGVFRLYDHQATLILTDEKQLRRIAEHPEMPTESRIPRRTSHRWLPVK